MNDLLTPEMEDQLSVVFDWIMDWILWIDTKINPPKLEHEYIEMSMLD